MAAAGARRRASLAGPSPALALAALALALALAGAVRVGGESVVGAGGEARECGACGAPVAEDVAGLPPRAPASPPSYESCAVVFASGLLLDFDLGEEIDAHDAVFRMNKHSPWKFEKHVGHRTSLRIINSQHDGEHDMMFTEFTRDSEVVLLRDWNTRAKSHAEWRKQSKFDVFRTLERARKSHPDRPMFLLSRGLMRLTEACAAPTNKSPTTGLTAVLVARQLCANVTVYGAGCPECGYYAPRRRTGTSPKDARAGGAEQFGTHFQTKFHNMTAEMRSLTRLAGIGADEIRQRGRFSIVGCASAGAPAEAGRGDSAGAEGGGGAGARVARARARA